MKVCGVELKGNDAIVCLMSLQDGFYNLHDCRVKKLSIRDTADGEQLKKFQFDFAQLMKDYQVERVVIRERQTKGKFAGAAAGFKLEAAIQLAEGFETELQNISHAKQALKQSKVNMDFRDTGLKQFQEQAFMTAFAYFEGLNLETE